MSKYFYLVLVIIILIVVFLAQQPFAQKAWPIVYEIVYEKGVKTGYAKVVNWWQTYEPKGREFFQKYVLSKITEEVEKRKEIIKEEFEEEKEKIEKEAEKITESIWQKITNYFKAQFQKIFE